MENKKKDVSLYSQTLTVLFILLFMGSVFIVSNRNFDLFETYRKYWTIVIGLLFIIVACTNITANKGRMNLSIDTILKGVFAAGVLESFFALAQLFKFLPSFNRYYTYTGSFDNPAIFAMLLSVSTPIAVYFAIHETVSLKRKTVWWIAALSLLVFIAFSESRTGLLAAILSSATVALSESEKLRKRLFNLHSLILLLPLAILLFYLIYRFKADSANGRILIWRIVMDMVKERPLMGFGPHGFSANYMEYQASYFLNNPQSRFLLLADNVNNPFNEFLLVLVNYGMMGLTIVFCTLVLIIKRIREFNGSCRSVITGLTIVLIIWSLFSYPFSIPFVWVITLLILTIAFKLVIQRTYKYSCPIIFVSCAVCMLLTLYRYFPEREWSMVSFRSQNEGKDIVLSDYIRLYERLSNNRRFLYNYGAELHYYGYYDESIDVLKECSSKLNDYDVQMLIGNCLQHTGDTLGAIERYCYANRMVPSRFLPQYNIMNLYIVSGDTVQAVRVANTILQKDVKIERSKAVQRIIREAGELLQTQNSQITTEITD